MNNEAITPAPPNMEAAAHKETRDFLEWLWANCKIVHHGPFGYREMTERVEIEEAYEKTL